MQPLFKLLAFIVAALQRARPVSHISTYPAAALSLAVIAATLTPLSGTAGDWDQENWDEMYWDGEAVSKPTAAPQTQVAVDGTDISITILNYTEGSGEDGWSAILGYDVTCLDSGGAQTYSGSSFSLTDLDEETEYTCTVSAFNSQGYGPESQFVATTEFMPGGLPIWLLYEASKQVNAGQSARVR